MKIWKISECPPELNKTLLLLLKKKKRKDKQKNWSNQYLLILPGKDERCAILPMVVSSL